LRVLIYGIYQIVIEAIGIGRVIGKNLEPVAVIPVQPLAGAQPQKALSVLVDAENGEL
jgi:hypothetical protein